MLSSLTQSKDPAAEHLVAASRRLVEAAQQYNAAGPGSVEAQNTLHRAALSFNDVAACVPDEAQPYAAIAVARTGPHADAVPTDIVQLVSQAEAQNKGARKQRRPFCSCFGRRKPAA